ncbi:MULTISPECIES: DUF3117 domain-containing protein [Arcanobacterium]|uniref:DUF3117 domain-containing protein n=1 Tax=Arcanobacterium bovis TaxID=2529275 RepID=A0A4Q9V1Z0_9ACTO|nr:MULTISPECIES: DUF3117 domain-containing protein [Arcanobacterium]MBM7825075.1 hypothetical protein [Arcanobacterium pluranimalium]TBW22140.1 DUF3117 domain-containing protein [Arcanobacterium bovis]
MAAMKPRTGDGPLEAERDNHGVTLKIPLEGGGRLVLSLTDDDVSEMVSVLEAIKK